MKPPRPVQTLLNFIHDKSPAPMKEIEKKAYTTIFSDDEKKLIKTLYRNLSGKKDSKSYQMSSKEKMSLTK